MVRQNFVHFHPHGENWEKGFFLEEKQKMRKMNLVIFCDEKYWNTYQNFEWKLSVQTFCHSGDNVIKISICIYRTHTQYCLKKTNLYLVSHSAEGEGGWSGMFHLQAWFLNFLWVIPHSPALCSWISHNYRARKVGQYHLSFLSPHPSTCLILSINEDQHATSHDWKLTKFCPQYMDGSVLIIQMYI